MKKLLIGLCTLVTVGAFAAPITPMDGYVTSDLTEREIQRVWRTMKNGEIIKKDSICSNRANVWSYEMKQRFNIDSKKIFIHFTDVYRHIRYDKQRHQSRLSRFVGRYTGNKVWFYHVAPAVEMNGETVVLDRQLSTSKKPQTEGEWAEDYLKGINRMLNSPSKRAKVVERLMKNIEKRRYRENLSARAMAKLKLDLRSLKMIRNTPKVNGKYKATCKLIENIVDHDLDENAWCHLQYASMYYWTPGNLRSLNYGTKNRPTAELYTPITRDRALDFVRTSFSYESVRQSYIQAFGIDITADEE